MSYCIMFRPSRLPVLLVAAGYLIVAAGVGRADWPEFRGPTGQGHAFGRQLPVHWSQDENVLWRTPLPGEGWSSPAVVDGRIYVTAATPIAASDDISLQLIVLDGASGEILNTVEVFRQTSAEAPGIHSKNSHASPSPIVDAGKIYVHFGHQGTACLASDGELIWETVIDYPPVHGNGGSPVLAGDQLIFSCDGKSEPFVVALDKATGQEQWRSPRATDAAKTFSFSTPLLIEVDGRPQVISPGSNRVVAYDPDTGDEIWHVRYEGYSVVPRPVYGHGMVYLSTSFDSAQVMAIRPDGQGDVTDSHVVWTASRGAPHTPSLLLVEDLLLMVSDRGVASCLDAITGELHWQERLGGGFSSSPLHAQGRVYFQNEDGETIVADAAAEYQELARNQLQERTLASFAVIDNDLLIRTKSNLYRIGKTGG